MIDRFQDYWAGRSQREQRLLAVMFVLLAVVILWFGIIAPLENARADARARLAQATSVAGRIAARAGALHLATRATPPPLGSSLIVAVGSAATDAGFTPSRLDPQGDDRVVIVIGSAKSTALFAWLDGLARRGIFTERITVSPNGDATVGCDATLRLRRS
jgi:general secretion pathway protein M